MSHSDLENALVALQAELRDLRRDALEPIEQFGRELTALRHEDKRLLATVRQSHALLTQRIDQMALKLDLLQSAAGDVTVKADAASAPESAPAPQP